MPLFNCEKCDYTTTTIQNIRAHMNRKTPCDKHKKILNADHNKITITRIPPKQIKPKEQKKDTTPLTDDNIESMIHNLFLKMDIDRIADLISIYAKTALTRSERLDFIELIMTDINTTESESEESESENDD